MVNSNRANRVAYLSDESRIRSGITRLPPIQPTAPPILTMLMLLPSLTMEISDDEASISAEKPPARKPTMTEVSM